MGEESIADGREGRIQRNPVLSALRDVRDHARVLCDKDGTIAHIFFKEAATKKLEAVGCMPHRTKGSHLENCNAWRQVDLDQWPFFMKKGVLEEKFFANAAEGDMPWIDDLKDVLRQLSPVPQSPATAVAKGRAAARL